MKPLYKDLIERAVWTAVQAFVAVWTVGGVDSLKSAGAAALAAGISVLKGFAATKVGDPNTAATVR